MLLQSQSRIVLVLEQIVQAQIKTKKHADISIKICSYCNRLYMIYVQVFGEPGGYPHRGYPSSRLPSTQEPARAGVYVFAKRQTHPAGLTLDAINIGLYPLQQNTVYWFSFLSVSSEKFCK